MQNIISTLKPKIRQQLYDQIYYELSPENVKRAYELFGSVQDLTDNFTRLAFDVCNEEAVKAEFFKLMANELQLQVGPIASYHNVMPHELCSVAANKLRNNENYRAALWKVAQADDVQKSKNGEEYTPISFIVRMLKQKVKDTNSGYLQRKGCSCEHNKKCECKCGSTKKHLCRCRRCDKTGEQFILDKSVNLRHNKSKHARVCLCKCTGLCDHYQMMIATGVYDVPVAQVRAHHGGHVHHDNRWDSLGHRTDEDLFNDADYKKCIDRLIDTSPIVEDAKLTPEQKKSIARIIAGDQLSDIEIESLRATGVVNIEAIVKATQLPPSKIKSEPRREVSLIEYMKRKQAQNE